jgi:hypothetical protein
MKAVPAVAVLSLFLPVLACTASAGGEAAPAVADDAAVDAMVQATTTDDGGGFCSRTANLLFEACGHDVLDEFLVASAKCVNVSSGAERETCSEEARAARAEGRTLCREQRAWRRDACTLVGQARYDPGLDPARFDDPRHPSNPNPWFPLAVGHRWEFRGGDEVDTVEVVDETKSIAGLTALVARDVVVKDGDVAEATDDWFALAKDGNVWYLGEEVKDFQSFDGDAPRRPELVSIEGSFKAGREGDKAGIIFQASPKVGQAYLEEFSLANAEDVTEILSTTYAVGRDPELDRHVPEALAKLLCAAGDCVVTRNISLLEPGVETRKYHARGIGFFLEVDPDSGDVQQLTSCNVDPRCASLPAP